MSHCKLATSFWSVRNLQSCVFVVNYTLVCGILRRCGKVCIEILFFKNLGALDFWLSLFGYIWKRGLLHPMGNCIDRGMWLSCFKIVPRSVSPMHVYFYFLGWWHIEILAVLNFGPRTIKRVWFYCLVVCDWDSNLRQKLRFICLE